MAGAVQEQVSVAGGSPARPRGERRTWRDGVVLLTQGLLVGVLWGAVARVWMRYVSDVPAFTWGGTLFILGLSALAGLSLAAVELLRRRGARAWRVMAALPALVLFAGPGMPMLPSAVLGGLAVSGRGGWWVRGPALLAALAPVPALVLLEGPSAFPNSLVLSLAWYVALCVWLALGWSLVFRRRTSSGRG